jgi:hypothetical protein
MWMRNEYMGGVSICDARKNVPRYFAVISPVAAISGFLPLLFKPFQELAESEKAIGL